MKVFYGRIIFTILSCFFLFPLNIGWTNEIKSNYRVTKPLVLHSLSGYGAYSRYDVVKSFIDAENHTIVLSSFGFSKNNEHKRMISLSICVDGKWVNSERIFLGYPTCQGVINNGVFELHVSYLSLFDEPENLQTFSIYHLNSDMELSREATATITIDLSKKVLKDEQDRQLRKLLPVEKCPETFFIIGHYRESRLLNPANFALALISGGHWGFVTRLYGAMFEQNKVTEHYSIPEKLKANNSLSSMDSILSDNKVHIIWVKNREYTNEPRVIQYSYFDLSKKQWNEITELFKGYKYSEKTANVFSSPSLACDNGNVYCVWSWDVADRTFDKPVRLKETGVYFCSEIDGHWNKPIKLADSGGQPQIIADNTGDVYIFWIEEYKGLFYKHRTHTGWSNTNLLVKDVPIRTKEVSLQGTSSPSFSIAVDSDNNFHIAYIRAASGFGGEDFMPEQLIYVELIGSRGSD
ncbi:MAG: hypothetical protein ACYS18_05550 [Planctomycetota bacterium]|jgi:hypothetical protein